jgi:hypothetical protein
MPEKLSDRQRRQIEHISSMAVLDVIRNIELSREDLNSLLDDITRRHELHATLRSAFNDALHKHIKPAI